MKALRLIYLLMGWVAVFGTVAGESGVVIERDVPAVMRDGVVLKCDVYGLPTGGHIPSWCGKPLTANTRSSSSGT